MEEVVERKFSENHKYPPKVPESCISRLAQIHFYQKRGTYGRKLYQMWRLFVEAVLNFFGVFLSTGALYMYIKNLWFWWSDYIAILQRITDKSIIWPAATDDPVHDV